LNPPDKALIYVLFWAGVDQKYEFALNISWSELREPTAPDDPAAQMAAEYDKFANSIHHANVTPVRPELVEGFTKSCKTRTDRELRRCGKFRCKILRKHARI
jgi:hypothetical protein